MSNTTETLQLIDSIPPRVSPFCYPIPDLGRLRIGCQLAQGSRSVREAAEEVVLWQGTAEALVEGRTSLGWSTADENGEEIYPNSDHRAAASCLLKRALGICPEVKND